MDFVNDVQQCQSQNYDFLLKHYDRYMYLKIYVTGSEKLKQKYIESANNHNEKLRKEPEFIDAGFDIFLPPNDKKTREIHGNLVPFYSTGWEDVGPVNKVNFQIKCSAQMHTQHRIYNTGYYVHPRSSLSKTHLRLANSTGIIDAGYRGNLLGMFDVVNIDETKLSDDREAEYFANEYDRLLQICAPDLIPVVVEIVDSVDDLGKLTSRGEGGFGSTGR